MASSHCPNPECPFLAKFHQPADYREGFTTCSDCGSTLVAGPAPTRAPAQAAVAVAAEPVLAVPRVEGTTGDAVRRVAVSLTVLVAAALCQQVMLPGLDSRFLEMMADMARAGLRAPDTLQFSVFALELNPFLSAFLLVELVALLVPPWRRLRTSGPRARARLRTAAVVLGLLLALFQSFGIARFYESFSFPDGQRVFSEGALPMPALTLLLAGGVLFLHLLTLVVERQGLGNGYAVVILGLSVPAMLGFAHEVATGWGTFNTVFLGLGAIGIIWGTARLLRKRLPGTSSGTERPSALGLPTSGLAPFIIASWLLSLPTTLANLDAHPALGELAELLSSSLWLHALVFFVLSTLLTAGFSVLFHSPQRVGATWAALTAKDEASRPEVHGRAALRARELVPSAVAWSLLLVTLAWLPSQLAGMFLSEQVPGAVTLLLAVAIFMDLRDEARMRLEGAWVAVWPVHRAYEVEPALAALTAAGIPARSRGGFAQALFQLFGPYFPVDLMVPPARAEEARALLEAAKRP